MKRTLGLCIALTCVTAFAFAQQPGGGAVGRGGRGGFGGGGFGGTTQLVQMEKVQTELKIKTGQKRRISELAEEMKTEMQGMFNFQEFQGLGDEQRQQLLQRPDALGEFLGGFARERLETVIVGQCRHLLGDSLPNLGASVSNVAIPERAHAVDVLVALVVEHESIFAPDNADDIGVGGFRIRPKERRMVGGELAHDVFIDDGARFCFFKNFELGFWRLADPFHGVG